MIRERVFPNTLASVTEARHFVQDIVGDLPRARTEEIAVMVSELTTNSVSHAASDFTITIRRSIDEIYIGVSDMGPGEPAMRSPRPTEPTGRGLQIVRELADRWGVIPAPNASGKTVWFSIDLNREYAN
jgi:anti-sigma regulatory factor (Ser/Thr protein kinase)